MDRAAITALRRSHGYPQFLLAATVARLGDEMFFVGITLLILDRTGSPTLAGLTVAAATLPSLASGPVAGAWLDRTGRRSLIYKVDRILVCVVLLTMLAAVGNAPNFVVPLLAVLAGLTMPVSWTGFTSFIPLLVEEEMLPHANAVEAASLNAGLIVGPALAGLLAAVGDPPAALIGEVVLTLVGLVLILRIPDLDRGGSEATVPLRTAVKTGLRHIVKEPVLRVVSVVGLFNNIGWGVLVVVFPLWAAADLGATENASGAIWSAFAFGSLIGALALSRIQARYPQHHVVFVATGVMGVGMLSWTLAAALAVALVLVFLTALIEGPTMAAVFSVRQQRTPVNLQAQVMGTLGSIQIAAFSVGSAVGGPLVENTSPRTSILVVGTVIVLAAVTGAAVRAATPVPVEG